MPDEQNALFRHPVATNRLLNDTYLYQQELVLRPRSSCSVAPGHLQVLLCLRREARPLAATAFSRTKASPAAAFEVVRVVVAASASRVVDRDLRGERSLIRLLLKPTLVETAGRRCIHYPPHLYALLPMTEAYQNPDVTECFPKQSAAYHLEEQEQEEEEEEYEDDKEESIGYL